MKIMKIADIPTGYEDSYPWKNGDTVLVLGEIENMIDHYIVATKDGKIHFGYHDDFFKEILEYEM